MANLDELTTPLTKDEIEDSIYAAIEARGTKTTSWQEGAIARTIIAGASIIMAAFSKLQATLAKSGFLELAEGSWLSLVALYVFGVTRNAGTFAAGEIEFNNGGGGVFSFGVGDVVAFNPATDKTYRNTEAFSLAALETGVLVDFEAVELGSGSTSAAGDITTLETTLLGVTITNPVAFVGADEETDPQLRVRATEKTGTLSPNGPADAYRYVARNAVKTDGTSAGVTRVTTVADGSGNVTVYIATATGGVTGTDGDPSTALGAVAEAIATQAEPLAVTATVISATPVDVNATYQAWVKGTIGLTSPELQTKIALALATAIALLPIGGLRKVPGTGYVFKEWVEGVIKGAIGSDSLIDLTVTLPAANVALAASEVPVSGAVIATVNIVSL